jgi:hypothetical protein
MNKETTIKKSAWEEAYSKIMTHNIVRTMENDIKTGKISFEDAYNKGVKEEGFVGDYKEWLILIVKNIKALIAAEESKTES